MAGKPAPTRDARLRQLSHEAAKYRTERNEWRQKAEAARVRVAELEGAQLDAETLQEDDEDDETASDDPQGTESQGTAGEGATEASDEQPDHSLRIENAFLRQAHAAGIAEVDDAWKLIDQSMIEVTDDGQVEGMDKAVLALTTKYPSLKGGAQRGSPPPPTSTSGRRPGKPQRSGYDTASLQKRFPAMRRGR